jgi:hypothetical protein
MAAGDWGKETAPATQVLVISPSDTTDFAEGKIVKAIDIGVDGDIKIKTRDDQTVTFKNRLAGTQLPVYAKRVYATGSAGGAGDYIGLI